MLVNLLQGFTVMIACLLLQAIVLVFAIRFYFKQEYQAEESAGFLHSLMVVVVIMLVLIIGNVAQIMIWAGLFIYVGEFNGFETAVYHSAVNFSTLGYGDLVMSDEHRLLGPIQAINGIIMVGVSTAALMLAFQNILKRKVHAPHD